jgi:hypothetical protein
MFKWGSSLMKHLTFDQLHHIAPNFRAAATPDLAPSSWKPHPRCAPANARRGPPACLKNAAALTALPHNQNLPLDS